MTTKLRDSLEPIVKELLKKRNDETIKARENKESVAKLKQEYEDTGLNRALISKPRDAPISEPVEVEPAEIPEEVPETPEKKNNSKAQCPECGEWFAKGGAFSKHYNSHFSGD